MAKNHDGHGSGKRAEKQTEIAGKFPFHKVAARNRKRYPKPGQK